jgi:inhibitor of KinA sporulation pathway (predicted exonuclease)
MILDKKNILIIDVEATCSNDGSVPREKMEIIEIGAIMINKNDINIISEFDIFIKPIMFPTLTEFCINLTSITQSDVDTALMFKDAFNIFRNWLNNFNNDYVFSSWGNFDRDILLRETKNKDVLYPFSNHVNLKSLFSQSINRKKQYGVRKGLNIIKENFDGIPHRAINDVKNMVKFLPYILNVKKLGD